MSKGKNGDDVALYVGADVTNLESYDGEHDDQTEAVMGLMACDIGTGDVDVEKNYFAEV